MEQGLGLRPPCGTHCALGDDNRCYSDEEDKVQQAPTGSSGGDHVVSFTPYLVQEELEGASLALTHKYSNTFTCIVNVLHNTKSTLGNTYNPATYSHFHTIDTLQLSPFRPDCYLCMCVEKHV